DGGQEGGACGEGGRHALGRTGAHVADREHAGHAGLERQGAAAGAASTLCQVEAGEDEALVVDGDVVAEPARAGIGADEEEEMAQRATVRGAVRAVPEHSGGEAALTVAGEFDDLLSD